MSYIADGDWYPNIQGTWATSAPNSSLSTSTSTSGGINDVFRQENTVVNVGIITGEYDSEFAALFSMET